MTARAAEAIRSVCSGEDAPVDEEEPATGVAAGEAELLLRSPLRLFLPLVLQPLLLLLL